MANNQEGSGVLFFVLVGVVTFAAGFLGLAIVITLFAALGFLTIV